MRATIIRTTRTVALYVLSEEPMTPTDALSNKRKVLPKLPKTRNPSHIEDLKERNKKLLKDKPWTLGLIEAMGFVDLIGRQKYETKNRTALNFARQQF
jgi:hypothetical protein